MTTHTQDRELLGRILQALDAALGRGGSREILPLMDDIRTHLAQPDAIGVAGGEVKWRCFHCDEGFITEEDAALHFGKHERNVPACTIDIAEYRDMQARMEAYNDEDAEIHRAMHRMEGNHHLALKREEIKGYERGLRDAVLLTPAEREGIQPAAPKSGDEVKIKGMPLKSAELYITTLEADRDYWKAQCESKSRDMAQGEQCQHNGRISSSASSTGRRCNFCGKDVEDDDNKTTLAELIEGLTKIIDKFADAEANEIPEDTPECDWFILDGAYQSGFELIDNNGDVLIVSAKNLIEFVRRYRDHPPTPALVSDDPQPTDYVCSLCFEPRFNTPSGPTCKNGHGGVEPA